MLVLISGITVLSGLAQLLAPEIVLRTVGGETGPAARHFFAIIGMFMLLFGGALLHALFSARPQPVVVLWAGLQKLGAAAAVGVGVVNGVFGGLALAVAGFDLLSGVLIGVYLFAPPAPAAARAERLAGVPAVH